MWLTAENPDESTLLDASPEACGACPATGTLGDMFLMTVGVEGPRAPLVADVVSDGVLEAADVKAGTVPPSDAPTDCRASPFGGGVRASRAPLAAEVVAGTADVKTGTVPPSDAPTDCRASPFGGGVRASRAPLAAEVVPGTADVKAGTVPPSDAPTDCRASPFGGGVRASRAPLAVEVVPGTADVRVGASPMDPARPVPCSIDDTLLCFVFLFSSIL